MGYTEILFVLYFIAKTEAVNIGVNGQIYFSPVISTTDIIQYRHRDNTERYGNGLIKMESYELQSNKDNEPEYAEVNEPQDLNSDKERRHQKHKPKRVTIFEDYDVERTTKHKKHKKKKPKFLDQQIKKYKAIFLNPSLAENNVEIRNYTNQVYNKFLRMWTELKTEMTDNELKRCIGGMSKRFDKAFHLFINDLKSTVIKSNKQAENIIVDTINKTRNIVKNLLHKFIPTKTGKRSLRSFSLLSNMIKQRVQNEIDAQTDYICKTFGICGSNSNFSTVLREITDVILQYNDFKFDTFFGVLVRSLQRQSYANIISYEIENLVKTILKGADRYATEFIRERYEILKNIFDVKHDREMITVMIGSENLAHGLAFIDIMNQLDEAIPQTSAEAILWRNFKNDFEEYLYDTKGDEVILKNVDIIVKHIIQALEKMDDNFKDKFEENVRQFLGNNVLGMSTVKYDREAL